MKTKDTDRTQLAIPDPIGYKIIETDQIEYLEGRNSQTVIHLAGKEELMITSEPLIQK
ncbi:MAG TPA: hypothetical protein VJY62_14510 [Bacteroidia bacterium]|nr:hypothetical protein [Bacteroidia bacterium]